VLTLTGRKKKNERDVKKKTIKKKENFSFHVLAPENHAETTHKKKIIQHIKILYFIFYVHNTKRNRVKCLTRLKPRDNKILTAAMKKQYK
jgi:hypothetical protein